jgi:hypothetical protein
LAHTSISREGSYFRKGKSNYFSLIGKEKLKDNNRFGLHIYFENERMEIMGEKF